MRLKIEIRRNSDGVIAEDVWEDWEWYSEIWQEGNFSCDCNRAIFFDKANGDTSKPLESYECSYGLYSVRCSDADTGEILYNEL